MVVETSRDVIAIERSGDYKGLYHVLEGALSPMEGIGADDIRVKNWLPAFGMVSYKRLFSPLTQT